LLDPPTREAILRFRQQNELTPTDSDEVDLNFMKKLQSLTAR
jgi:hypothetical protein